MIALYLRHRARELGLVPLTMPARPVVVLEPLTMPARPVVVLEPPTMPARPVVVLEPPPAPPPPTARKQSGLVARARSGNGTKIHALRKDGVTHCGTHCGTVLRNAEKWRAGYFLVDCKVCREKLAILEARGKAKWASEKVRR